MTRPRGDGAAPADVPTEAMAAAVAAAPAPATGGMTDEAIARLKQLAELHAAGILTEAEFAEQKAKVLVP